MEKKMCPRCNEVVMEYPALSRRDNKTEICSECGREEAMIDLMLNQTDSKLPTISREFHFMRKIIKGLKCTTEKT